MFCYFPKKKEQQYEQKINRFKADKAIKILNESIGLFKDCGFDIYEFLSKKRVEILKYRIDNV